MIPKAAAAIITGTIARPSRPSVRLTALPAETITKDPKARKKTPRSTTKPLIAGRARPVVCAVPSFVIAKQAVIAMATSKASRRRPERPFCVCFVTFNKSSQKPIAPKPPVTTNTIQTK